MRKNAYVRLLTLAIFLTPMTLLMLGAVFMDNSPSLIRTSKILWVGESAVNLLPVAGIKIFVNGGTIEQVSKQVDAPYYPAVDYTHIFILAGVGDIFFGRKSDQEIELGLKLLSDKLYRKYKTRPIIINPHTIADIFLDESTPKAPDGVHLSYEGSLLIVDLVKQELRKTNPFISDESLRQQYLGFESSRASPRTLQ